MYTTLCVDFVFGADCGVVGRLGPEGAQQIAAALVSTPHGHLKSLRVPGISPYILSFGCAVFLPYQTAASAMEAQLHLHKCCFLIAYWKIWTSVVLFFVLRIWCAGLSPRVFR